MISIIDRYIFKKFLLSFLFTLCLIVFIIMLIDLTEKNDYFIRNNLSFKEIAGYYYSFLPFMTNMVTPITIFITTVFVNARLTQRTEIVAILSGGISFARFLLPYLVGASLIAIGSFVLTGWILADANKKRVAFEQKYIDGPSNTSNKKLHIKLTDEVYLYIDYYRSYNQTGTDVTLETIRNNQLIEKLSAKSLHWNQESNSWVFKKWINRQIDGKDEYITHGELVEKSLNLRPDDFTINPKLHEMLTITELSKHIQNLKAKGADRISLFLTEQYVRYMSPFASIILTCMSVIVSSRKSRGGMGLQIALGFILALTYIAFFLFSKGAAEIKGTNILLTVWTPNLIFSAITFVLYKLTPK